MSTEKLVKAEEEIKKHRAEVVRKLLQFADTDSLLFWSRDAELAQRQEKIWLPIIIWANDEIHLKNKPIYGLDIPISEQKKPNIDSFLEALSDRELTAFYLAALNMNSELLAAALVKGKISAQQAFDAAYLEELWQAETWGAENAALQRRECLKEELEEIESFLQQNASVSLTGC